MPQVHLCDPQLLNLGGHYLNHDGQLIRELQRRGIPVSLYARKGCQLTCAGLTPAQVFSHDIFQESRTDPEIWAMENFHGMNQLFMGDLRGLPDDRFGPDDLIYFPNLLQNQLYAVAQWLNRFPAGRRPAVAVMLRFLNHRMPYVQTRLHVGLIPLYYRYAARILAKVQPRSFLCADTKELAAEYRRITGLPVMELPDPMDVSDLPAPAAAAPSDRPVVVYQGSTSTLRGFHFLPEIIAQGLKLSPRPRFVVQVQAAEAAVQSMGLSPVLEQLERLAGEDVRLLRGPLSSEDFLGLLRSADVVLLPYSPEFYGHGSSGVFTEAVSLGKAVVVSPQTVPARQAGEFGLGVVTAGQWSAPAMAAGLAEAVRRLPELTAAAAASAPRFCRENSAAALWDKLLSAAFPGAASQAEGQLAGAR